MSFYQSNPNNGKYHFDPTYTYFWNQISKITSFLDKMAMQWSTRLPFIFLLKKTSTEYLWSY